MPEELAGARDAVIDDIETSAVGRAAVRSYIWLMDHAPKSTRGKILFATVMILVVAAPSLALLYLCLLYTSPSPRD